jgi:hypothetical protein
MLVPHKNAMVLKDIVRINCNLRDELQNLKNSIENNAAWDVAKRNINEYESIFSSSKKHKKICKKNPISRAYFKLWEILTDFNDEIFGNHQISHNNSMTTTHIAEGPGGFIECLIDFKRLHGISIRSMNGITLLIQSPTENKVPFWKLNKELCAKNNIYINRKIDNIGDLYNVSNIDNFTQRAGKNNSKLVTADGGFDFSIDFNNQEYSFLQLFLSEIYTATTVQATGGSFVIKIFDMFTVETNCLMSILYKLYETIYITKPFTSRPANSEKYLVCLNYNAVNNDVLIEDMRLEIIHKNGIRNSLGKYFNAHIATRLCTYNTYYTNRQMEYLKNTLKEAERLKNNDVYIHANDSTIKKCIDWCKMYEIEYDY